MASMQAIDNAAGATSQQEDEAEQDQYLTFGLAGEMFAVKMHWVREVLDLQHIAKLANAPPILLGITNVRGAGIPVIDLKRKFGMPESETTDQSRIVVLQVQGADGGLTLGALTDAVYEVTQLAADAVEAPPRIGMDWDRSYMLGIGRQDGRFVTLLDLDRVFATERLEILADA